MPRECGHGSAAHLENRDPSGTAAQKSGLTPGSLAPVSTSTRAAPPLGQNRDFAIYWAGQALSSLGDGFAMVATPLLVLGATGSVAAMGGITAVTTGGQLIASLGAGLIADRLDRRRLMIACDAARAVLWGIVPLWWHFVGPSLALLVAVTALAAIAGNVFYVACFAAVPGLVREEDVVSANSRLHGTYAFMGLFGPMLSGLVCSRWGPVAGIGVNAVSFVVSALSIGLVELDNAVDSQAPPSVPASVALRHGRLASSFAGVIFLWRSPLLRVVALALGATAFLTAAKTDLVIYHLQSDLHAGSAGVGVVLGVAGIGSIAASAVAASFHRRAGFGWSWLIAGAVATVPLAVLGALGHRSSIPVVAALLLVTAFGETLRAIASQSLRHAITPNRILGRVTAALWAIVDLPSVLGAILITALAVRMGAIRALGAVGVLALAVAVFSWAALPRDQKS